MIIARNLGTIGKGEVYLVTQVFTLIQVIFSFGFGPAIIYYLKRKEIKESQVNFFILVYVAFIAVLFAIGLFYLATPIQYLIGGEVKMYYLFLAFVIAFINLFSLFVGYKMMVKDKGIELWSVITLVGNVSYLLLIAVLVIYFQIGVVGVLYGLIASSFLKLIVLFYYNNIVKPLAKISVVNLKKLSTYGIQIFLTNLFLTGVFRIDAFFLNRMVSISELGLYSVSVNIGELLLLIPSAVGVALFPHLAGLDRTQQKTTMALVGRLSFMLGAIGVVGLALIGYPFILVIFGDKFINAFQPFLLLLPGLMAMTLNYSYSNYFSSIGKPLVGGAVFCIGLIINIILNLWLIPIFGIHGAAISSSIAYTVITIGFIYKIRQVDNISIKEFVLPKNSDFLYAKKKIMVFLNKK